jgi:DNA-binding NtrC family response regulator
LIVDDEPAVLEVARSMLETMGFEVITALDGRSGIKAFGDNAEHIRLVLLDLTMPGLSGIETLRAMTSLRHVPAILSSGYDEPAAAEGAGSVRWSAFLKKPYRYAELVAVVRRALAE